MGWFWGSSNNDDPVKKLDPGLREYLENEAPQKYVPAPQRPEPVKEEAQPVSSVLNDSSTPSVPSASLFPDGRYAHLWKTYKPPVDAAADPLGSIESTQSLTQGVESMNERRKRRRDTIGNAALENCAIEREEMFRCFEKSTFMERFKARATMGHEENKRFTRCYSTQAVSFTFPHHQTESVPRD